MRTRFRSFLDAFLRWYEALPRLYRRFVQALAVVIVAAIVFGGAQLWHRMFGHDPYCSNQGATIVKHASGECVGVSDGHYVFAPELAAVEQDIRTENERVRAQHSGEYVSVAYLLPISGSSGSIQSMTNVVEQLRGAYTAQYRANRESVNGIVPAIQLLVGNDGYQANQWQTAADIIKDTRGRTRLVAVAGLGVSLTTTIAATRYLTSVAGIPVVGGTITADDFDDIGKFIRVAPSNLASVAVAVQYIGKQFKHAVLVEDENTNDAYDRTLVSGFQRFGDSDHALTGREAYDTGPRTSAPNDQARARADEMIRNRISQMTANICTAQPAAVLFAGRGRDLAQLVTALAGRPCLSTPITVVSGDDVTNLTVTDAVKKGLASGVTVDYAGIANPDQWSDPGALGPVGAAGGQGFKAFDNYFQQQFPGAPLTDGNSMVAYDAVLTAISAIRLTSQPQPELEAVAGELGALHKSNEVLGATGPLDFYADYDTNPTASDPEGKPIPILQLSPTGDSTFRYLDVPGGQGTSR